MIPNEIIEKVKDENDIIKVISSYVSLEQRGKNYFGLCPFHDDSSPSMSVSPEKKIYHCFSCGAGGNVINFVQNYESIHYVEAVKKLAENVNIDLSNYLTTDPKSELKQQIYKANFFANEFFKYYLKTNQGEKALKYLVEQRKLNKDLIAKFEIGYSPANRSYIVESVKKNNLSVPLFEKAGIIKKDEKHEYSIFADRLMFPIKNENGNVIAFSGRSLIADAKVAKYINTSETEVFNKSSVLYNLHEAKIYMKQSNTAVLFEGFMDVIAAYSCGVKNSIAAMGTAFTKYHAQKIKKYCNTVVLCFDGDDAGTKSTLAASKILQQEDINVKAVYLNGMDPDDYVKKEGQTAFLNLVNAALDIDTYVYKLFKSKCDFNNHSEVLSFVKKIYDYLTHSVKNATNEYLLRQLEIDTKISYDSLLMDFKKHKKSLYTNNKYKEIPKVNSKVISNAANSTEKNKKHTTSEFEEVCLISIIQNQSLFMKFKDDFSKVMNHEKIRKIFLYALNIYETYGNISSQQIIKELLEENESTLYEYLNKIYKSNINLIFTDEESIEELLYKIRIIKSKEEIAKLRAESRLTNDFEEKQKMLKKIEELRRENEV